MEGHEGKQETQTGQEYAEWTDTGWDLGESWTDADLWLSDWNTHLWNDPAWEQAARQLPSIWPKNCSIQRRQHFNFRLFDDVRVVSR